MKNLILLILIFSSLHLTAQESIRKIHFGATLNPQLNMTSFGGSKYVKKENSFCFGVSADVYFDLNPKLQLKSGLGVQYLTLRHRDSSARWPSQGTNGEFNPDFDDAYFGYNTDYLFASLPVNLKIKFTDKPDHIYIVGGMTPMAQINHSGEIVFKEPGGIPSSYPIDGFLFKSESLLVILDLGIGYEWRLGKTKMFLEPNLQQSLGKFFEEKNVSARANGRILLTGLKMGVYI